MVADFSSPSFSPTISISPHPIGSHPQYVRSAGCSQKKAWVQPNDSTEIRRLEKLKVYRQKEEEQEEGGVDFVNKISYKLKIPVRSEDLEVLSYLGFVIGHAMVAALIYDT